MTLEDNYDDVTLIDYDSANDVTPYKQKHSNHDVTELHQTADVTSYQHARVVARRRWKGALIACASAALAMMLPYIHIGIIHLKFWVPNKRPVDRESCSCSCWDTVFKGSYVRGPSDKNGYMHMYFNATGSMLVIWLVTSSGLVLLYEAIKYVISLRVRGRLCGRWAAMFVLGLVPNYYGWGGIIGYFNDEFYQLLNQQLYLSATELVMSVAVLWMCDKDKEVSILPLLVTLAISTMHLLVGSLDQFIAQLLHGQGARFQKSRDISLVLPDLVIAAVAGWELYRDHRHRQGGCRTYMMYVSLAVLGGVVLGRCL